MTKEQIIRLLQDTIDGLNGKDNGFENVDVWRNPILPKNLIWSDENPDLKQTQHAVYITFKTTDTSSGAED